MRKTTKNGWSKMLLLSVLSILFDFILISCASTSSQITYDVSPKQDESLIIIERPRKFIGFAASYEVYVDDFIKVSVRNGESKRFIISNGEHTIYARNAIVRDVTTNEIKININSEKLVFKLEVLGQLLTGISRTKL